ncbi:hypothetical protein FACS1894156_0560 [Bacteroidia bacterium]|nr:hypothetical protein FACS1894156_0560 [Bacteroidia bacterium]
MGKDETHSWQQARNEWSKKNGKVRVSELPAGASTSAQPVKKEPEKPKPIVKQQETAPAPQKPSPPPSKPVVAAAQPVKKEAEKPKPIVKQQETAPAPKAPSPPPSKPILASAKPIKKEEIEQKQPVKQQPVEPEKKSQVVEIQQVAISTPTVSNTFVSGDSVFALVGILTAQMWDELFPNRYGVALKGKNSVEEVGANDFFSFAAFVEACRHFPAFLNEGDETTQRRELAAFLAHIAQETGHLRFVEQLTVKRSYSVSNNDYPPVEGKDYHGRGPIQLSYNYNYGQFSAAYFDDKNVMLNHPELLSQDSVVSFGSAIWFWMTPQPPKPACHNVITGTWTPSEMDIDYNRLPGFGLTLNIINATQCGSEAPDLVQNRYDAYEKFCYYLGVDKGENCSCAEQIPYGKKK